MSKKLILSNATKKQYLVVFLFLLFFVFGLFVASDTFAEKAMTIGPSDQTSRIIMGTSGSKVGIGGDPGSYNLNVNGTLNVTGAITSNQSLQSFINASNVSAGNFGSNTGGGNYSFPAGVSAANFTGPLSGSADMVDGVHAVQLFNNMGYSHGAFNSFDDPSNYGSQFIHTVSGPVSGAGQYYAIGLGLGSDYAYSSYAMQFAIPRLSQGGTPYPAVRFREAGSWSGWSKIYAGYADTSGSATSATTATNLSGGSVSGTTGYFSGNLSVSMNNTTGGGIIFSDDGDIADLNDAYASMRFSSGVRIFSANRGGSPVITLGSNGVVTASSFSGALNAANVSSGNFGSNTGGGNYGFGISPRVKLDVSGGGNSYGTNIYGMWTPDGNSLIRNWALNDGPNNFGGDYTYVSDAAMGANVMRYSSPNNWRNAQWIPVDITKTYKVSVWGRSVSGTAYNYLSLTQAKYDLSDFGNGGWGHPYFVGYTYFPTTWTQYTMTIGPAGSGAQYSWYADTKYVQLGALMIYGGSGVVDLTGYKIEEVPSTLQAGTSALGNLNVAGTVTASGFSGNGSGLTSVSASYANSAGSAPANGGTATYATYLNPLSGDNNYKLAYTADSARTNAGEWGRAVMYYVPNGQTYGIRVDRADYSDSAGNADTTDGQHLGTGNSPTFNYVYGSGSIRFGDMWGGAGLYQPSGNMVFGTSGGQWIFSLSASNKAIIGTDGNLWMAWAGDWMSNILSAKATHRGEGTNYIDYSRYVYNNGAYSGSGWIEPSDLGVRYAGTAGIASNATQLPTDYVGGVQTNPQVYFGVNTGLKVAMTGYPNVWSDTLWINGYAGGDVPWMNALHFIRNGQPRMWISTQRDDSTSYGTAYEIISGYNIASQSVSYANSASNSDMVDGMHFSWSNRSNGPTYVWAADGYGDSYLSYVPAMSVNYANSANTANTANYVTGNNNNLNLSAGDGIGFRFWDGSGDYKIAMGNTGEYHYGPVNDYSIKNFMEYGTGRGFTWGRPGTTPIAALNVYSGDMQIGGNMTANAFTYLSDRSLKTNINTIQDPLAKIMQLRGVTFNWKKDNSPSVGVIAQEVETVFPELVSESGGIKSVQYGNLVAPLIEAVKQQQTEIEQLKAQQKDFDLLKIQVQNLETKVKKSSIKK